MSLPILPIWDEGRVDGLGPVIQFFIHCQPEAQGVRTRQDDLHSHGGEHIGKEGSRVNKVFHQRDLVDEHISWGPIRVAVHSLVLSANGSRFSTV